MHLENSEEMLTFAPDDESQKRLVVRHRVFFDANYSRIRRLERSLIRNPQKSQSPELPLYKEILQIFPKLRKIERKTKKLVTIVSYNIVNDGDSNVFSEEYGAKLKEGDQIFLITYSNESYTSKAIGD